MEVMNDAGLTHEALAKASNDYQEVDTMIDEKTMRWLELQEK